MDYEAIIGMEVHAQLSVESKMFCRCSADIIDQGPNSVVCPVCLALPGALPTINSRAVEYSFMAALALQCTVTEGQVWFDRKNYFYPDLPKGYQISQHSAVVGRGGALAITLNGVPREIGISDVHLEEDTARLYHREEGADRHTR